MEALEIVQNLAAAGEPAAALALAGHRHQVAVSDALARAPGVYIRLWRGPDGGWLTICSSGAVLGMWLVGGADIRWDALDDVIDFCGQIVHRRPPEMRARLEIDAPRTRLRHYAEHLGLPLQPPDELFRLARDLAPGLIEVDLEVKFRAGWPAHVHELMEGAISDRALDLRGNHQEPTVTVSIFGLPSRLPRVV